METLQAFEHYAAELSPFNAVAKSKQNNLRRFMKTLEIYGGSLIEKKHSDSTASVLFNNISQDLLQVS